MNLKSGKESGIIYLHFTLLGMVVLLLYAPSLNSYFFADDFGNILYLESVIENNWFGFFENFTGAPCGFEQLKVYRPLQMTSVLFDYLLYKGNSVGYHLTCVLVYMANTILIYLVSREITSHQAMRQGDWIAFFTALIFAVNPLHCESVCWYAGAVDSKCCLLYLISILFCINCIGSRSRIKACVASLFFALALLMKEMAVGLPVVITFFVILDINKSGQNFANRLVASRYLLISIWLTLFFYFCIRYFCIGTLIGGYSGEKAVELAISALINWLDPWCFIRLFLPLDQSLFFGDTFISMILIACYLFCFIVIVLSEIDKSTLKWIAFVIIWSISTAVPLFQVWGLDQELTCARYVFFLTIPLSFFFPITLLKTCFKDKGETLWKPAIVFTPLMLICIILFFVSYVTSSKWNMAGYEVKELKKSCFDIHKSYTKESPALVLNLPTRKGNIPMIYSGQLYSRLLAPPFSKVSIREKFYSFLPWGYNPFDEIVSDQLKLKMANSKDYGALVWSRKDMKFEKLDFEKPKDELKKLNLLKDARVSENGGQRVSFRVSVNPFDYDFLELKLKNMSVRSKEPTSVYAGFNQIKSTIKELKFKSYMDFRWREPVRVRLSNNWRWYSKSKVESVELLLSQIKFSDLSQINLVPSKMVSPIIYARDSDESNVCSISPLESINLEVDALDVEFASKVVMEVSKVDHKLFDKVNQPDAVQARLIFDKLKGPVTIPGNLLKSTGSFHIRALCVNDSDKPLGEYSDPVFVVCRKAALNKAGFR